MALVSKILACLGVISAAILLAAALDLGNIHLAQTLGIWASIPLGLFVIGSIMHIFVGGGGGDEEFDEEEFLETFKSHKSKTASRLSDFQTKLDSMSGQDNDSLAEENKLLKDQLEAIHQAERDKVLTEAEALRTKNVELEQQIKQWAIDTVADSVKAEAEGQDDGQAEAA